MSKHLTLAAITLFSILYQIEALYPISNEINEKFRQEEIVPDVLEDLPELKPLKISYPSKVKVNLGNILTPTQVKDQPKVEWDAEKDTFYTLLMTGNVLRWQLIFYCTIEPLSITVCISKTPMLHREKNQWEESLDIGWP